MLLKKHTEEHSASRGFTIAELGAGLGVFALAASLMIPMDMPTGTMFADGGTIQTVNDANDNRKLPTSPKVEAVEVTVLDANGNEVKKQTVTDPNATSTVITDLDSNGTYTFEIAKINKAGASAKATAKLDYKQTGSRTENYEVDVPITVEKSKSYPASARQVDNTSDPIYVTVENRADPRYRTDVQRYYVNVEKSEPRVRVEYSNYNHQHVETRFRPESRTRSYNHVHHHSRGWNHTHWSNHTHRSSYCHMHGRGRGRWCHRHSSSYNHRHSSNHTHYDRWTSNHTHTERYTVNVAYNHFTNHVHTATQYVSYTYTWTEREERTRNVRVFIGYGTKQEFRGYRQKTVYTSCIPGKGCETRSSPFTRTDRWTEPSTRRESRSRQVPVWGHVAQKQVKAPSNFVVFKASEVSTNRFLSGGKIAAVGAGVSNASAGQSKSFLRWSGRSFTFNGERYIQVHKWALRG